MARIRTIKPGHVTDKKLPEISLQAHLFWVLSWCFSDDEGVLENDPLFLKSQLFPRRNDIRLEQIEQWIEQLVKARFMIPFTHNGESYLLQRTFKTHQKIDRAQPSKIPDEIIRRTLDECSMNDQPCIVEDSISKSSVNNRANALVLPGQDDGQQKSLKKNYQQKIEECKGKDRKTIWACIKEFIEKEKPEFIEPYVDAWNLFAGTYGLSTVETISDARKKKFGTRIKEPGFDMLKILERVKTSPHLKGDNDRGWKVTFDWIIENQKNYLKIIEGHYN